VQPLPIAAAYHPSSLRQLRTSIFTPSEQSTSANDSSANAEAVTEQVKLPAEISHSILSAEKRAKSALDIVLARTKLMGDELRRKCKHAKETQRSKVEDQRIMKLNLWLNDGLQSSNIDFSVCLAPLYV
jgi:hypothetical protein